LLRALERGLLEVLTVDVEIQDPRKVLFYVELVIFVYDDGHVDFISP
jgi:hypothetical protein